MRRLVGGMMLVGVLTACVPLLPVRQLPQSDTVCVPRYTLHPGYLPAYPPLGTDAE
jgi:hypothetical protein